jgi:hypothetical protein
LLKPYGPGAVDERTAVLEAAGRIPRVLADLAVPHTSGGSFRLTDHQVQLALADEDGFRRTTPPSPFTWSARTARRAIGLSAVRALAAGVARTPVDGVRTPSTTASGPPGRESHLPPQWTAGWLGSPPLGWRSSTPTA